MWYKLDVLLAEEDPLLIEELSFLLTEGQALGIEYDGLDDYLDNDLNLFGELRDPETMPPQMIPKITAYFDDQDLLEENIKKLQSLAIDFKLQWQSVPGEDWQRNWMQYYQIEHLSRFIKVVPLWKDYQADADELVIKLDPGLAFGTGNHHTTRLSALAMELVMRKGERVLDVGTGSGILSFIAGALGASQVWGFDLDPQAIHAAKENLLIQENTQVQSLIDQGKINFQVNDLMKGFQGTVDLIVANILPHILVEMLADAEANLQPGQYLILSGILKEKGQEIEAAMAEYAFSLSHCLTAGQWLCYIYQRIED